MSLPIIVIAGTTASGKSSLSLDLAEKLPSLNLPNAEILCADSVTIYRGFDIGSAKPSKSDQEKIPHHLLDIRDGEDTFTAGDFVEAALPIIQSLHAKNKIPMLVGGTGFYLRALLQGMTEQTEEESVLGEKIKKELVDELASGNINKLYSEMLERDPALKEKIHIQDEYRVIRALQAMRSTGKRWSELNAMARMRPPRFQNVHYFCVDVDKDSLRENVKRRTEKMLQMGLEEETKSLLSRGIPKSAKPMQSIGYREVVDCLEGKFPSSELPAQIEFSTMRLAKQQRTWFRGEKQALWIKNLSDISQALVLGSKHE
jgi:tRNA dimethylallyltransferase